jgi:hypothetical protein
VKTRSYARGLVVGAFSLLAFVSGTATAHADPAGATPIPVIPELGQFDTVDAPSLFTNPADRGRPLQKNYDGFGMYCQNLFVRCG